MLARPEVPAPGHIATGCCDGVFFGGGGATWQRLHIADCMHSAAGAPLLHWQCCSAAACAARSCCSTYSRRRLYPPSTMRLSEDHNKGSTYLTTNKIASVIFAGVGYQSEQQTRMLTHFIGLECLQRRANIHHVQQHICWKTEESKVCPGRATLGTEQRIHWIRVKCKTVAA